MTGTGFVHLQVRSAFSFLWGTFHPEELVTRAKKLGQKAVALTDLNGLYGAVRFYRAAKRAGIKPIIGAEVTLEGEHTIILLAKNYEGYRNLCRLLTRAHLENPRGNPALKFAYLSIFNQGLICLASGRNSLLRSLLKYGKTDEAKNFLLYLREALSNQHDLFVILQNHFLPEDEKVLHAAYALARELDLPVVATNEVAYLRPEDYEVHQALVGIARAFHHRKVDPLPNDTFYFATAEEMAARVPYPEAIENTVLVAELCSLDLPSLLALAVFVGRARLIDNAIIGQKLAFFQTQHPIGIS